MKDFFQKLQRSIAGFFENSSWNQKRPIKSQLLLYKGHPEAAVVVCYFNPTKSPLRRQVFSRFYQSISHLNHLIIECLIGDDAASELSVYGKNVISIRAKDALWHKESLINYAVGNLPKQYRYVFWADADILLTNPNWIIEAVARLQNDAMIVQPFEFCVHLEKNEGDFPKTDIETLKKSSQFPIEKTERVPQKRLWRSFAANWETNRKLAESKNYDEHGHVGFVWGARRELLEAVPLYDRALIGGADHIIAHAAVGQIPSDCIDKSFTADLDEVYNWSRRFFSSARGRVAYVRGDLYHIWHGDLSKRDYLNRIRDFTPIAKDVRQRDENGLYTTDNSRITDYAENYFNYREVSDSQSYSDYSSAGSDKTWTGFGGGGDFQGAGAGGEWQSNESSIAFASGSELSAADYASVSGSIESSAFSDGNFS